MTRALSLSLLLALACGDDPTLDGSCGDGVRQDREQCDDGNTASGDGCSAFCVTEGEGGSVFDPAHPLHVNVEPYDSAPPFSDTEEEGSFRIKCAFSHLNFDDPIVFPGEEGAAHLHMYFGNVDVDHSTTGETIVGAAGSTCQGGPLNLTGYWIPSVLRPRYERTDDGDWARDERGEPIPTGEWKVIYPVDTFELDQRGVARRDDSGELMLNDNLGPDIYYKRILEDSDVQPPPVGLRMIAGNGRATPEDPQRPRTIRWACHDEVVRGERDDRDEPTIPRCAPNGDPSQVDRLHLAVFFRPCWDGENLDSEDHKSHMAYIEYDEASDTFGCPASHPVVLPEVSYQIYFPVTAETVGPSGDTRDWRLSSDHYEVGEGSPGGASAHGDWMMAWDPEVAATFTQTCLMEQRHCANGDLGNGFRLASERPGWEGPGDLVPAPHR